MSSLGEIDRTSRKQTDGVRLRAGRDLWMGGTGVILGAILCLWVPIWLVAVVGLICWGQGLWHVVRAI